MFRLEKAADNSLAGLGTNLHKVTRHAEICAYLAVNDNAVVVHVNKVMSVYDMKLLSEFIINNAATKLQSVVTNVDERNSIIRKPQNVVRPH